MAVSDWELARKQIEDWETEEQEDIDDDDALRSRHWIVYCGEVVMGIKITERTPGQFDGVPHSAYSAPCPFARHGSHDAIPATAEEYEEATCDDDDS